MSHPDLHTVPTLLRKHISREVEEVKRYLVWLLSQILVKKHCTDFCHMKCVKLKNNQEHTHAHTQNHQSYVRLPVEGANNSKYAQFYDRTEKFGIIIQLRWNGYRYHFSTEFRMHISIKMHADSSWPAILTESILLEVFNRTPRNSRVYWTYPFLILLLTKIENDKPLIIFAGHARVHFFYVFGYTILLLSVKICWKVSFTLLCLPLFDINLAW